MHTHDHDHDHHHTPPARLTRALVGPCPTMTDNSTLPATGMETAAVSITITAGTETAIGTKIGTATITTEMAKVTTAMATAITVMAETATIVAKARD